jgi:hypothetical protein
MSLKARLLDPRSNALESPVLLPSKGRFYQSYDPSKGVRVRPIAFEDELAIAKGINDPSFNVISFLIERTMTGVAQEELLGFDRFAILLKLREISYSNECKSTVVCPVCRTENVLNFSLKDFPINFVPDDVKDPREVFLPELKIKAKVRFPRVGELDQLKITNVAKDLWRFVVAIEDVEDMSQIAELIYDTRFPLRDSKVLLESVLGSDYGVQTTANYKCCNEDCQAVNEARFEVGPDFLSFGT